jgi:diguanylate cyclase (GGDEF)-like protein
MVLLAALTQWRRIREGPPRLRKVLFAILFFFLFLITDGSSAASQSWEGAPPTYWPVGLAVALFLYGGAAYAPLIYVSGVVAAVLNYHRLLFGWCGIRGVAGLYVWYLAAAALLRSRWRIDPRLSTLRDVRRYILVFLIAETFSAITGMLTLLGDGLIRSSDAVTTTVQWWASDTIAIFAGAPFLLVCVLPQVDRWLNCFDDGRSAISSNTPSRAKIIEVAAQAVSALVAIWIVFGFAPAIPYQPLYLLFIPLVWVAVRYGLPGSALAVFAIDVGLTFGAWITQAPHGSMPRLQLAMLALGITGLCLGSVVTEGKRAEEDLRRSQAGLEEAQRVARLGSWTLDIATGRVTWTEELYHMLGFDPSLPAPTLAEQERVFTPKSWQRLNFAIEETLSNGVPYELELETVRPDGNTGWIIARGGPQRDAHGDIVALCGIAQDITDRKLVEKRVQFLAYYDSLTGLPNRTLLQDRLAQAIAAAHRRNEHAAVLFLDLDRFKIINDSLGHGVGDLLLKSVAERLKRQTRDQDTVCRMGGDEFIIVLSAIRDEAEAAIVAERIVSAIDADFMIDGRTLKVSCSLGISIYPEHGADSEALIKNADAAMYGAKESGRNRFFFFTKEMNAKVLERSILEQDLRLAIERNEMFLMYQPQVDIRIGKIVGLEALVRWQHPVLGLVQPDKFIYVAENSGLILPIGDWVLRSACSQVRAWQAEGLPPVTVAVNVSSMQVHQENFRELVQRALSDAGIAPQYLELELTESLLTKNATVMFSVLNEMKKMGVNLAIDDFGTGYSSLSQLRQFPVGKLKIDRSFIRDVETSPDAEVIATAVISLAKTLNLRVIAEGVETEAQLAFLQSHDCDEIQGYYFSRPLVVKEIPGLLRSNHIATLAAHAGH